MRPSKKLSLFAAAPLVAVLTLSAAPTAFAAPVPVAASAQPSASALLAKARVALPTDARARLEAALARAGVAPTPAGAIGAIDPAQYQCGPTELNAWGARVTAGWTEEDFLIIGLLGVDQWATIDAMLFPESTSFGRKGEYTRVMNTTFAKLGRFWDVGAGSTRIFGMHSRMVTDPAKVSRLLQVVFGLPGEVADELAPEFAQYFSAPRFDYGNHPVFSLGAFATPEAELMPGLAVNRKIVVGDGILDAYRDLGYADVAPAQILSHEYAHQVQITLGDVLDMNGGAVETRRTELMADAMSTYADTHPLGMSYQWKRARQMLAVSYSIGDCGFDSAGHHGTPNQRMRAAEWGYQLREAQRPRASIVGSRQFVTTFDAALPSLVAPDA